MHFFLSVECVHSRLHRNNEIIMEYIAMQRMISSLFYSLSFCKKMNSVSWSERRWRTHIYTCSCMAIVLNRSCWVDTKRWHLYGNWKHIRCCCCLFNVSCVLWTELITSHNTICVDGVWCMRVWWATQTMWKFRMNDICYKYAVHLQWPNTSFSWVLTW